MHPESQVYHDSLCQDHNPTYIHNARSRPPGPIIRRHRSRLRDSFLPDSSPTDQILQVTRICNMCNTKYM